MEALVKPWTKEAYTHAMTKHSISNTQKPLSLKFYQISILRRSANVMSISKRKANACLLNSISFQRYSLILKSPKNPAS